MRIVPKISHSSSNFDVNRVASSVDHWLYIPEPREDGDVFLLFRIGNSNELLRMSLFAFDQVGLLNVDGYYNPLLTLFDNALEEGFLKLSARSIVVSARTPSELLDKLEVCMLLMQHSSSHQPIYMMLCGP